MTNKQGDCCDNCQENIHAALKQQQGCRDIDCPCHTTKESDWQSIFLTAGTNKLRIDCSALVETVSYILTKQKASTLDEVKVLVEEKIGIWHNTRSTAIQLEKAAVLDALQNLLTTLEQKRGENE